MFYQEMKQLADDLIDEFGSQFVLKDPQGNTKAKLTGVFVENIKAQAPDQSSGGFLSQVQGQMRMLVKSSKEPQVGWLVTTDQQTFRVLEVIQVKPASTTIYYEVMVSR